MPKIEKPCHQCSKPVLKWPSHWKNNPLGFCSKACRSAWMSAAFRGEKNPCWRGGRYIEPEKGYVMVRAPAHHRARQNGYALEHILVMEKKLDRRLAPGEVVHHKDHDPQNNHPDNLELYASNGEHLRAEGHHRPKAPPCACGRDHVARGMCSTCYSRWKRRRKKNTGKTVRRG